MPCWTIIADYNGGTYVHQTIGHSPDHAVAAFVKNALGNVPIPQQDTAGLDACAPVRNVKNVWATSGLTSTDSRLLLHVIKTEAPGSMA